VDSQKRGNESSAGARVNSCAFVPPHLFQMLVHPLGEGLLLYGVSFVCKHTKRTGISESWLAGPIDSLRQWPLRYDTMQVVSGRRVTSNRSAPRCDLAIGDDDPTVIANYRCNRVTIIAASFRCAGGVANGACHRARLSSAIAIAIPASTESRDWSHR